MYPHKSGSQKRKERKGREQEEEKLKSKKMILQYFKPQSTPQQDECGAVNISPEEIDQEDTSTSTPTAITSSTEDMTTEAVPSVSVPEVVEDIPESTTNITGNQGALQSEESEEPTCSRMPDSAAQSGTLRVEEDLEAWKDPATWPDVLHDKERESIVLSGLMNEEELKKMAQSMTKDGDGRSFSEFLLFAKSSNGREKTLRDWLRWSNRKHVLYCITCLAFSNEPHNKAASFLCRKEGFDPSKTKWHQLYMRLPEHENSAQHRRYYWSWRTLQKSISGHGIDSEVQKNLATEAERFTLLLERLLDVTLFLASRNLAFRGSTQRIGDIKNGNFLGTLEIIAHYDSVLREHLEKVKTSQEKGKKLPAHYQIGRAHV